MWSGIHRWHLRCGHSCSGEAVRISSPPGPLFFFSPRAKHSPLRSKGYEGTANMMENTVPKEEQYLRNKNPAGCKMVKGELQDGHGGVWRTGGQKKTTKWKRM